MKIKSNYFLTSFLVATLSSNPAGVIAAPGQLADSPLTLASGVQGNLFFSLDDSGSMAWEILKTNGDPNYAGDLHMNFDAAISGGSDRDKRELCAGYNAQAFDPEVNYTPWVQTDEAGENKFKDRTLKEALWFPERSDGDWVDTRYPYGGYNERSPRYDYNLVDISNHRYYVWTDTNSNGSFDNGECNVGGTALKVSDLSVEKQTDYANWFTYYRRRDQILRRAVTELIDGSSLRMGLATLHDNNDVGTPIRDMTIASNKTALLNNAVNITSSGGTPLIRLLDNTGKYFDKSASTPSALGFSSSSPILSEDDGGECQQNFAVLFSDGFYNSSRPSVGNRDGDDNTEWDGGLYGDAYSNTLADVAMKYYENDLATGLDPEVPTQGVDLNDEQHLVTYTVAFGVTGTLPADKEPGDEGFPAWPKPENDRPTAVDDMRHAAFNGRGKFLNAREPSALIGSLSDAISSIKGSLGAASAVALNSTASRENQQVFQGSYNADGWSGSLVAKTIRADGTLTAATWDAGALLKARTSARQIITYNGERGIPLSWPETYKSLVSSRGDLSADQVADLLVNAPYPAETTDEAEIDENNEFGEDIINFLRGDSSKEMELFRARGGYRLGDIVHSSPVFVGPPKARYPDSLESVPYSEFRDKEENRDRRNLVYVGANDGMLHAFDADDANGAENDGEEVFAYMPGVVFSSVAGEGIHALADKDYAHRYYVDGTPTVADVFIDDEWKTVLVGGLRGGGKGVYALDITDPSTLTETDGSVQSVPLWEYTDDDLGFTYSDVRIARMQNGKWAAVFGNGYNNEGDGRAKLYIVYLDGTGHRIIDTQVGNNDGASCTGETSDCNGLSTPAMADINGDVTVDRIYAGDLHGNMWAFDVSGEDPLSWGVVNQKGDETVKPIALFEACRSDGETPCPEADRQPITSEPSLVKHPTRRSISTSPNIMVFFGTGQYLTANDNVTDDDQSYYGVWDGGDYGLSPRDTPLTASNLVTQTVTTDGDKRTNTSNTVNYKPGGVDAEYGWRINLPADKERVVVDSQVLGEIVFFNTIIPSNSPCAGAGGGWLMNVDLLTGGQPPFAVVDFDSDGDFSEEPVVSGSYIGASPTASRFLDRGDNKLIRLTVDHKGGVGGDPVKDKEPTGKKRISWTDLEY